MDKRATLLLFDAAFITPPRMRLLMLAAMPPLRQPSRYALFF